MTAEELKELVAKSSVSPLHIYMRNGAMYLVNHPELVVVSRTMVVIGTGLDKPVSGIPDRLAFCPLAHIARVGTFPKAAA